MTFQQQEELFAKFIKEQKAIMFKKGNDYASQDRLSNFKVTGAITQLTPELAALQMIATKVARLGVLLQPGKVPNNESIDDSVVDLANYAFLLLCVLREKSSEGKFTGTEFLTTMDPTKISGGTITGIGHIEGGTITGVSSNDIVYRNDSTQEGDLPQEASPIRARRV